MNVFFGYIPDGKERIEQFKGRVRPMKTKDIAGEARAEIIRDLLKEGKTVEDIEMIIRCFGL